MELRRRLFNANDISLPNGYQKVRYIMNEGQSYIDTGYYPNGNTNVIARYSDCVSAGILYGAYNSTWTDGLGYYINTTGDGRNPFYYYYSNTRLRVPFYEAAEIITDKGKVTIDGNVVNDSGVRSFNITRTLYIFKGNGPHSGANQYLKCKLHYFTIKENGTKIRNFIPCVRKSDSKPGMYDTVTKTFFTNAGTGEFIVPE